MSRFMQRRDAHILVIDDEEVNIRLLQRTLAGAGYENVLCTTNPSDAARLFAESSPDLVLLDLHMPGTDGFQLLRELAGDLEANGQVPVLMLTGDDSPEAKRGALALGARDFVTKPFDNLEVLLRIENLLENRFIHRALENQNVVLEERVKERTGNLEQAQLEILERLARAAEFRDDETGRHTQRVGILAERLALALGSEAGFAELIKRAAPLHDVGKIGIPDGILLKPCKLTPIEFETMKTHTLIGAQILSGGTSEIIVLAETIALSHHEWWDGTGYPGSLEGAEIPFAARIVAVADFLDAVTHRRPYRAAWTLKAALKAIERASGSHFDVDIVSALFSSECYQDVKSVNVKPGRQPVA
jgi:putative two-component system response regulator